MFGGKAKKENEELRQYASQMQQYTNDLQQRVQELEHTLEETGAGDIVRVKSAHAAAVAAHEEFILLADQKRAELEQGLAERHRNITELQTKVDANRAELVSVNSQLELQDQGLFEFPHPAEASVQLGEQLARTREQIKQMVRSKQAVNATQDFHFNGSQSQGRKFINDMSKMMLRSYNAEAENAILTVRAGNLPAALKRVQRAKDQAERLGRMITLTISPVYHALRTEELTLAAQHLQAKQAAKDAEREERARLREERKAQAEMEKEKKRLEKERAHYENTIESLRQQGRLDELGELESKLADITRGIEDVDYRAANIRAGYVYVISNIGAFGERMVKIGMTRRLEPLDRVRELSDASVPFNFDVHAMFFSEDAVGVEAELHRRFAAKRVNRINTRREFFYVEPAEVKRELAEIQGSLLEFTVDPAAEQYRESQKIAEAELSPASV